MTFAMSQSRCLFAAGGDSNSSPVNDSESDVAVTSDRAFLIGVAGGTASGKVIVLLFECGCTIVGLVLFSVRTDGNQA